MYLLAPFILQNFSKKILELIQSYEDVCQFWDQNSPFVPNKFIYLLAFFIVQNLNKFLLRIQNYDDASFLGQKWSICP